MGVERERMRPLPSREDARRPGAFDARADDPAPDLLLAPREHAQPQSARHGVDVRRNRRPARRDAIEPWGRRYEGRLRVRAPTELRRDAVAILEKHLHAEVNVPGRTGELSRQAHLLENLC
jgi:hypothetical protein